MVWEQTCRLEKEVVFLTILWSKDNIEKADNEKQVEEQSNGERVTGREIKHENGLNAWICGIIESGCLFLSIFFPLLSLPKCK